MARDLRLAGDDDATPSPGAGAVDVPAGVGVLGPLTVRARGGEVTLRASRQRRLLSVLAAAGDRVIGVAELVEALYGDAAGAQARHSLATELWRARQVLGAGAIVTEHDGYRFDPAVCEVDADVFERRVGAGRAALRAGDHAGAHREFAAALALWRGDPLGEWRAHPAAEAARTRLQELHTGALIDHAEALAGLGRHAEVVAALEQVVRADTTHEHAWALLVESHLALGRHRDARAAFDTARRTLAGYGVEVGAELQAVRGLLARSPAPRDAAPPVAAPPADPVGTEPAALVGRDTEVAELSRTLRAAFARRATTLAVVSGEAGIGKTGLVEHVLAGPLGAGAVVRARCDRRVDLPYGPWQPALRPLADLSGTPLPRVLAALAAGPVAGAAAPAAAGGPAGGRAALRDGIGALLAAAADRAGGLVLVLEDAHWAPAETLEVLLDLVARHDAVPLALVVTVRRPDPARDDVGPALAELRRRAALSLSLTGLDREAAVAVLPPGTDPVLVERVHRLTGGNPLYLTRLARLGDGSAPRLDHDPSLAAAIDDHVADLSAGTVEVLRLAAVVGARVDRRILVAAAVRAPNRLAPTEVDAGVAEAVAAGVLRPAEDEHGLAFVHELVRDRLYETTPAGRRTGWHVAVASAAERVVGGSGTSVDVIAHHYASAWPACPTATAVTHLQRAGRAAAAQLGFEQAARYYGRALDLLAMDGADDDTATRADLVEAQAQAVLAATDVSRPEHTRESLVRARALFDALARLAERPGAGPALRLRGALGVARSYSQHRIDESVLDRLADALAGVCDGPGLGAADRALTGEALSVLRNYRPAQAGALLERVAARDRSASGPLHAAAWAQQPVVERLRTARLLATDPSADPLGAWVRLWVSEVGAGQRALDDPPPQRPPAGAGGPAARWEVAAWEITAAIATGRFARADRALQAAGPQVPLGSTTSEIATRAAAAMAQRIRWRVLSTDRPLRPDDVHVPSSTWITSNPIMRSWTAYLAASTGQLDVARRACAELVEQYQDGVVQVADLLPWACGAATAAAAVRDRDCAEVVVTALAPHAGEHAVYSFTAYWGGVDHHVGRLLRVLDDPGAAVDRLEAAVVGYRHAGARAYLALATHDLALALWDRGRPADRERARRARSDAVALADELGMGSVVAAPWPG